MSEDIDMEMLRRATESLEEHFDTIHIFATRHEQGSLSGTVNANYGSGNWFARRGQIRDWAIKQDEYTRRECEPTE